jgi:SAM-dependent methyltransferase
VISRFGTMFFADQTAALANIRRGLRPGGRLCLATWQPLEANDWLTIPGAALLRYGNLSDTEAGAPGMFAQRTLARELRGQSAQHHRSGRRA